jgi:hypothetical protein
MKLSRVQRSLDGCDRWDKGRGMLYFKASVVQWKDIRSWRPELGLKEALVSGNNKFFGQ